MPKMRVEVLKDAIGFPSIVTITKNGRKMRVTTDPNIGFTIEGQDGILPDFMEAFRVILPRVSYQKTTGVIQGEDNSEVSTTGGAYSLQKILGIYLNTSRTLNQIIASLKSANPSSTAGIKITYQVEGGAETTWMEETTTSATYVIFRNTLSLDIEEEVTLRLYLSGTVAGADNTQFTAVGETLALMGHVF